MCGICGIVHHDRDRPVDRNVLSTMNRTMVHRGPDDEGYFFGHGVGIAMRRLAIIDPAGGHQPVTDESGNIVAAINGEIYNFQDLRRDLEARGHTFRSHSDAEVLPHLYEEFGKESIEHLVGMFGLCVWDERHRRLILARDRMGKKPLYWVQHKGIFLFASELKALLAHPEVKPSLDPISLSKYLAYEYVPSPRSIFQGIQKLEAGHVIIWEKGNVSVRQYWDIPTEGEERHISEEEAVAEFLARFERSVRLRLIADVPLGAFLSGGIDSSCVVAAMAAMKPAHEIKTFSIAFEEKTFDESSHARSVAAHFGTDHHEKIVTARDLLSLVPDIADVLDEPLGDASVVPTLALSRFARETVTVALGGDGGDELFAGYPTFVAERMVRLYQMIPSWMRNGILEPLANALPVSDENISFDFKIKQFLKGARSKELDRHFLWMGSFDSGESAQLLLSDVVENPYNDIARFTEASHLASHGNRLLYLYQKLYLQDDILTKVDRASMRASLECRSPFLDHRLVEFVARLPYRFKLRATTTKYLLKKAFANRLPKGIADRAKKGFGIPVAQWIKAPLHELTCDLLSSERIRRQGIFQASTVERLLSEHLRGKRDHRKQLWTLLAFQLWHSRWC